MTIVPRRSALYMPGANARALEKAKTLAADVLLIDLEDSVAPDAKDEARAQVGRALSAGGFDGREVVVRVNGSDSAWFEADVAMLADTPADGVLIPKVNSGAHLAEVRSRLASAGVRADLPVWAMIETPLGVLNVSEIAAAAPSTANPLVCFVIGTNDLVKETRATLDAARTSALYWLSATVTAARAYGIDVIDGVYNAHTDLEGFERECRQGLALGMDGKSVIHPRQIDGANAVFAPDAEAVEAAAKIIAAFDAPENAGKGVISLDGKMVELLHAEMARRTVAIAQAIAARATQAS